MRAGQVREENCGANDKLEKTFCQDLSSFGVTESDQTLVRTRTTLILPSDPQKKRTKAMRPPSAIALAIGPLLFLACAAQPRQKQEQNMKEQIHLAAPIAKREAYAMVHHGHQRVDPYYLAAR